MSTPTFIPASIFSGLQDKHPLAGDLQYPGDLNEWHGIRQADDRKNVPLWSPVTYKEGRLRAKNETWGNIETVNAIVLDYDSKPPQPLVTMDRAQEVWGFAEHVIHTTGSHEPPPGRPRFRLVMPLDRPARVPEEFSRVWRALWLLADSQGVTFDPLADAGRMYFVPTRRVDVDHKPEYRHNKGQVLSVDELVAIQMHLDPGFVPKSLGGTPSPAGDSALPQAPPGTGTGVFAGIDKLHQREDWGRIKEQCAFARHCEEDAASLSEPEWYAALSLVVRCKGGDELVHKISEPYPGYDRAATEEKAERALHDTGPVTCERARVLSGLCAGCPSAAALADMKSPVQLGAPDPETATEEELQEDRKARVQDALVRAEDRLTRARAAVAEAMVRESELRAVVKFQTKYALTAEEVAEAADAHGQSRVALQAAKEEVKFAESRARKMRIAARITEGDDAVDSAMLDQLALSPNTGAVIPRHSNIVKVLRSDTRYRGRYRYDLFHERIRYLDGFASDHADARIMESLEERYDITLPDKVFQKSLLQVSHENEFHPVRDYLEGLEWDGEQRLANLITEGLGGYGEDEEYLAEAGTKMCISAVARILDPGCKVDTMIVLVGAQGVGKSKGLQALSCGWFADTRIDIASKDGMQALEGKWFYEIAELDSFRKAESSRIKAFITSKVDHYRPPYGRHALDRPRQTILVGSTNEEEFLTDPTGSRRFVPVHVRKPSAAWILEHRDQLWAEAVVRYRRGEEWWYENESAIRLARMSEEHQRKDIWESTVRNWLIATGRSKEAVTLLEALTQAVMLPVSQVDDRHKQRMGALLISLGCTKKRQRLAGGSRGYGYIIPEALLDADDSNLIVAASWSPSIAGTN